MAEWGFHLQKGLESKYLDLIGLKIKKKANSPKKHYSGIKLNTTRPFNYRKMQLPLHRDNCILFFL
ncbi:MAG: hypothetical protein KH407_09965, partial [Streptococcus sp.]|nr:hypothetical protein [Streptococcus sp.]